LAKDFPNLKVANRGISGDVTRGVWYRLPEDVLDLEPSAIVLLIGVPGNIRATGDYPMSDRVTTNAAQGNPHQPDIYFRGFAASPVLGTPQGLSVFLDGMRVNESFGDVVNWDLIPRAAIARVAAQIAEALQELEESDERHRRLADLRRRLLPEAEHGRI
jgi:lysophospholipase L1-like esterase